MIIDITPVTGLADPLVVIHINGCGHAVLAEYVADLARDLLAAAQVALTEDPDGDA